MVHNKKTLKEFGITSKGSIFRLSKTLYGYTIRERTSGGFEDVIFKGTRKECENKIQEHINAGYGVIV